MGPMIMAMGKESCIVGGGARWEKGYGGEDGGP